MKFFQKFLLAFSLFLVFAAITAFFLFFATLIDSGYFASWGESSNVSGSNSRPLSELVGPRFLFQERVVEIVLFWWVFFFGAAIGSFLNVVVWRMPRGKTIVWKGSFCPRCRADIRFRDNIPIAGWWMLKGKCRKCELPIPVRYPLVEFITGILVFGLFLLTTQTDGWVYPMAELKFSGWHFWLLDQFVGTMVVVPLYHVFLLSVFITAWWIRVDGAKFPWLLFAITICFGVIYPALLAISGPLWSLYSVNLTFPGSKMIFFPEQAEPAFSLTTVGLLMARQVGFAVAGGLAGAVVTWILVLINNNLFQNFPAIDGDVATIQSEEGETILGEDVRNPPYKWELALFYSLVGLYCGGSLLISFLFVHLTLTILIGFCFPSAHRLSGRSAWLVLPFSLIGSFAGWRVVWNWISSAL